MKEIDFLEKKEALNKEMLKYIEDGVKILGGTADIHRMVGYAVVSFDGHETTKEICINEVEIKRGILRFHDANALDEITPGTRKTNSYGALWTPYATLSKGCWRLCQVMKALPRTSERNLPISLKRYSPAMAAALIGNTSITSTQWKTTL